MPNEKAIAGSDARPAQPNIRKIGVPDLMDALAKGLDDFKAMPSHALFLIVMYPVIMLVVIRLAAGYDVLPLVFPLVAGYALIGPVAAIGLYELSRRREQGLEISWARAFNVLRSPSIGGIVMLGVGLTVIFFAWLGAAMAIYELTFGGATPESVAGFATQIFTTQAGWSLIIIGSGVGFCFAVVSFTFGVVSFPLILDRDVGVVTAVRTSIRAVLANSPTMALWGFIVAALLVIGAVPFFVGLAIVLPVLGHATWHLYRKVVEH